MISAVIITCSSLPLWLCKNFMLLNAYKKHRIWNKIDHIWPCLYLFCFLQQTNGTVYWYNNFESAFQGSDTIWRASLSQIVTNLLDLLTWLGLWVGGGEQENIFPAIFKLSAKLDWKQCFCVFSIFKKVKAQIWYWEIAELCNFRGNFDVLCSPNPIYASTSTLITYLYSK